MRTQVTHEVIRCDVCEQITQSPRTLGINDTPYDVCSICEQAVNRMLPFLSVLGLTWKWTSGD